MESTLKGKIEQLENELENEHSELQRLQGELTEVQGLVVELTQQRATTVKLVAQGQEKEVSTVAAIEKRLTPLQLRAEGLAGLIADQEGEVKSLHVKIGQAREALSAALKDHVDQGLRDHAAGLVSGIAERERHIKSLYLSLCLALGGYSVDAQLVAQISLIPNLGDSLNRLTASNLGQIHENYTHVLTGHHTRIVLHSLIDCNWPVNGVNPVEGAKLRIQDLSAQLSETFPG